MDKTIVVAIRRRRLHRLYKKFVNMTKKVKAHDESNECKTGDMVRVVECRPLSKDKRWRLLEMIRTYTSLNVADNSGAKRATCIRVLGGTRRVYASLGDVIVVAIKDAIPNAPVKKGTVERAVVVRTKKEYR